MKDIRLRQKKTHNLLFTERRLCYNECNIKHGVADRKHSMKHDSTSSRVIMNAILNTDEIIGTRGNDMLKALRKINCMLRTVAIIAGAAIVIFKLMEGKNSANDKVEGGRTEVFDDIF